METPHPDPRPWLEQAIGRKVTVQEIAEALDVSRPTATRRLGDHMTADEIIQLCTHLGANPATALVELGYLDRDAFVQSLPEHTRPVDSLTDPQLAHELFRRLARRDLNNK